MVQQVITGKETVLSPIPPAKSRVRRVHSRCTIRERKEERDVRRTSIELTPSVYDSISICSRRFLVSGNSFGNPKSQMLQKTQIAPNTAKPSHQFPTHRLSSTVSEVWAPSSTNIRRNLEITTNPTIAPERMTKRRNESLWTS